MTTIPLAPLPDHNLVTDPLWLRMFHSYRHVIAPLRYNGWTTNVEMCGNEFNIRADLGDGTELIINTREDLPLNPDDVTGWHVARQGIENPSRHTLLYDSTDDGAQSHHGTSLIPMFARIDELDVPKVATRLIVSATHVSPYGATHNQASGLETPGRAIARYFEWARRYTTDEGYRCAWERPGQDGSPLTTLFESAGHITILRVTRSDD